MDPTSTPTSRLRWPWLCLVAAMVWVALVRVPLVLNAESHLDSDLAVDGLTLLEATQGHWRWHFPGTPYMGTPAIWPSLPGALVFGTTPSTLVVGGVVSYELFVLATFLLAWKAFGPGVAAWSLVPMAFASVGTVWLSGRLTGGHLLTLFWHAAAILLVPDFGPRRGYFKALAYGAWCGFGYYLDSMFLMTLPFAAFLALAAVFPAPGGLRKVGLVAALAAGFAIGDAPRELGALLETHDAYGEQFATIFDLPPGTPPVDGRTKALLVGHVKILALECLPRLITGHLFTSLDLPTEPRPDALASAPPWRERRETSLIGILTVAVATAAFFGAIVALSVACLPASVAGIVNRPWAIAWSGVLALILFVLNKNIYNSDNYRYLVYLLVPWSIGFGTLMSRFWRGRASDSGLKAGVPLSRRMGGRLAAVGLSVGLGLLVTLDTLHWYRGFGWVGDWGRPVRRSVEDPMLDWLREHRDLPGFFGGYWDVYRYQFLLGGTPIGLPYPNYPDRYNAAGRFPNHQPRIMVARKGELGNFYIVKAREEGGRALLETRERILFDWPRAR